MTFNLKSEFKPSGDQPKAIAALEEGLHSGQSHQILMGVTGSGKTFTIANLIARVNRPALVIAHNKTLAAQLCAEFREFFPDSAVEYFVSYYDYYQPEAYIPSRDIYIEKEVDINTEIERLRHSATRSLLTRKDVIIVASVSCIYGLGAPEDYQKGIIHVEKGQSLSRKAFLLNLEKNQYTRNDVELRPGRYRIKGDVLDLFPVWDEILLRLDFFGDEVDRILKIHPITGEILGNLEAIDIFPATHYVVADGISKAMNAIQEELQIRVENLTKIGRLVEAQRLSQRTKYDIEMMLEIGYCKGIENYSRHISGRSPGSAPGVLIDFFPKDFITIIDESHVTIGQIKGMHAGDQSRKKNLIEYGFRLPSAADNRPLTFDEFESRIGQCIYISATPGDYELQKCPHIVEQIIRPTGLVDPEVIVKSTLHQIDDLLSEIDLVLKRKERVLITTLTKQMSESLCEFLVEKGLKVKYLHSEIKALERMTILRDLRLGKFDVLVGVNLLREGLDLPEVALVTIFDADKEGFLRNERSLIQTMGRAARNINGRVILYADKTTQSMQKAISETNRRRKIQLDHNKQHHITPQSIIKTVAQDYENEVLFTELPDQPSKLPALIAKLEKEMNTAAKNLEFEIAAVIRDRIETLKRS